MAGVLPMYKPEYIEAPFAAVVADWCITYYNKHNTVPGVHIQDIFKRHSRRETVDDATLDLIEMFLDSISEEFERSENFNVDYLLKESETYFKTRALELLADNIKLRIENNKPLQDIESLVSDYTAPIVEAAVKSEVFDDDDFWVEEESESHVLFKMPGALGDVMGPIERDTFIGILAKEKSGKTWMVIDMAMRALKAGCNVAFFGVGDLTERQMKTRLRSYIYGISPRYKNKKTIMQPILDCYHNQTQECPIDKAPENDLVIKEKKQAKGKKKRSTPSIEILTYEDLPDHRPCTRCAKDRELISNFKGAVWHKEVRVKDVMSVPVDEKRKKFKQRVGAGRFRMHISESNTTTVGGIKNILKVWEHQCGFVPDVIIIDYADILAPENPKLDFRHQENSKWMGLRGLSQRYNCAVITVTQSTRGGYEKESLEDVDVSEDKRKLSHVTAMYALNQTSKDKKRGVVRFAPIMVREDDFDIKKNVIILRCLSLGKPYIASYV